MGWYGYETTGQRAPARICQMTIDLHGWRPGASSVELQMGDSGGPLPVAADDRRKLAEALKREVATAVEELLLD